VAPGGFVFSASYAAKTHSINSPVELTSPLGGRLDLVAPWENTIVTDAQSGETIRLQSGTAPNHPEEHTISFNTVAGGEYSIAQA
jgi:hypothetical protein